jgi:hypothetical protein
MTDKEALKPTYTVEYRDAALHVVAPNRKNGFIALIATLLWIGLLIQLVPGVYMGSLQDATSGWRPSTWFLMVLLRIVMLASIFLLTTIWLHLVISRQAIEFGDSLIKVRRVILIGNRVVSLPFSQEYSCEYIRNLRTFPPVLYWLGPYVFHYKGQVVRFGAGFEEAEAREVLRIVQERFPSYESLLETTI